MRMQSGLKKRIPALCVLATVSVVACGGIRNYTTVQQEVGRTLQTYPGGTILRIEKEESLPNAVGGADIWGGRRPTGSVELKYLGLADDGRIKLRIISTDITTNENWRRRLRRAGYATSTSDAVDFEHDAETPFEMEGHLVKFVAVTASELTYRIHEAPQ